MKKNFLKYLLLGVFTLSLGAGFVGCKDYDDDIDELRSEISELKKELTSAKSDLTAAKQAAEEAKAAAATAQAAADKAASEAITEAQVKEAAEAAAKAAADKAVADAKFASLEEVDAKISKAISELELGGGGMTEAQVKALLEPIEAQLSLFGISLKSVEATATSQAIATLKLQALVMDIYGAPIADLNALIAELEAGTKTAADVNWDEINAWIEAVNPGLSLDNALTPLKSFAYIPTWYDNGQPTVLFYWINDIESGSNKFAISSNPEMTFRMNPSNAKVSTGIEWSFLNRWAWVTRAAGDEYDLVSIKKTTVNADNTVTFKVAANHDNAQYDYDPFATGSHPTENPHIADFIQLRAVAPVDPSDDASAKHEIVSDEIKALFIEANAFIGDTVRLVADRAAGITNTLDTYDYYTNLTALKATPATYFEHTVAYNQGAVNLNDYVFASAESIHSFSVRQQLPQMDINEYYYKFTSISYVPNETGVDPTDQAFFVSLNQATGVFNILNGSASINRTPIFQADLIGPTGKAIARHYIKFKILPQVVKPIDVDPIVIGNVPYLDLYETTTTVPGASGVPSWVNYAGKYYDLLSDSYTNRYGDYGTPNYAQRAILTWQKMNVDVYAKLGLSHEQFLREYHRPTLVVDHKVAGPGKLLPDLGAIDDTQYAAGPNTGTVPVQVWIHPQTRFGAHEWQIRFEPVDPTMYPAVEIPVTFTLVPPAKPQFDPSYVVNISTDPMSETKGKMMNSGSGNSYHMQATLEESFFMQTWVDNVVDQIVPVSDATNPIYALLTTDESRIRGYQTHLFSFGFDNTGWAARYTADAIEHSGSPLEGEIDRVNAPQWTQAKNVYNFRGQDIKLNVPIDVDYWTFNVKFRSTYENMEDLDVDWKFRFYNPIDATLTPISLATELQPDVKRLRNHLSVSMLGTAIYTNGTANGTNWSIYGFQAINQMPWAIAYDDLSEGDGTQGVKALYITVVDDNAYNTANANNYWNGGNVNVAPYNAIYWSNAGTKLQTDKRSEKITVTVGTSYAVRKLQADIVLKKTESF